MTTQAKSGQGDDFGAMPEGFADFPRIWREQCAPALAALESERKGAVRTLAIGAAFAAAVFIGINFIGEQPVWVIVPLVLLAIGALVFGGIKLAAVSKKAKGALIHPAVTALGFRHRESGFQPPAFDMLREYRLLPGHEKAQFEDMIEGEAHDADNGGGDFAICEAHLTVKVRTKNGSHDVTVFRGLIGRVTHPAKVLGQTVLQRDAGIFNAMAAPSGMKRAGLGAPEFEKTFELFTTDQVEARYLVTPLVMQQLLALEAQFKGKKVRAAFAGGALVFALESRNLFEPGSPFSSFNNPKRMHSLIADLAAVRSLVLSLRGLKAGS